MIVENVATTENNQLVETVIPKHYGLDPSEQHPAILVPNYTGTVLSSTVKVMVQ